MKTSEEFSSVELRRRIAGLTPADRERLLRALRERTDNAGGLARPRHRAAGRLVACVSTRNGHEFDAELLRDFLGQRLPDYMVPQVFVALETLPRTPAGKLDRAALPDCDLHLDAATDAAAVVTPRDDKERILAAIWAEVLGLDEVSVYDDFFELGGDSLLSIRILSRAVSAGLRISPEKFFAHPTIAEQAAIAEAEAAVRKEGGPITGNVPLLPIQHWFFEKVTSGQNHWNQSSLFRANESIDLALLDRAAQELLLKHDALRTLFQATEDGWVQTIAQPGLNVPVTCTDFSQVDPEALDAAVEQLATAMNGEFELDQPPLLRIVLIRAGAKGADRLLIVAHHLVVDAVSFRILTEDLETAYRQLHRGQPVDLPEAGTSIRAWSRRLAEFVETVIQPEETQFWLDAARKVSGDFPSDSPADRLRNVVARVSNITMTIDAAVTRTLLRVLPSSFRCEPREVLLAALLAAVTDLTRNDSLSVDLEGHGREALFEDMDISRTVGWFTTVYPVHLQRRGAEKPGELLAATKEQLRAIPRKGIGYGLLRYLGNNDSIAAELSRSDEPPIVFNYLGQLDRLEEGGSLLKLERNRCGHTRGADTRRAHFLDINAWVSEGKLTVDWHYNVEFHREESIRRIATGFNTFLEELIVESQDERGGLITPSDFPLADLDQQRLDKLAELIDEIDND